MEYVYFETAQHNAFIAPSDTTVFKRLGGTITIDISTRMTMHPIMDSIRIFKTQEQAFNYMNERGRYLDGLANEEKVRMGTMEVSAVGLSAAIDMLKGR